MNPTGHCCCPTKKRHRDATMDSLLADIRFATRSLLRRRTFAVVAIGTIALTIGAATSIFSVVDGVLLRALPFRDPGQLVAVWQTYPQWLKEPILARNWDRIPLNYGDFIRWRQKQTVFTGIGLYAGQSMILPGSAGPELVIGSRASPGLFEILGAKPVAGRFFLPGEDVIGGPHVTVISHEAWESRFGSRRDVIGTTIAFDRVPHTIVGVLPTGFS